MRTTPGIAPVRRRGILAQARLVLALAGVVAVVASACAPAPSDPPPSGGPPGSPASSPAAARMDPPPAAPVVVSLDRTRGSASVGYPMRVSAAALGREGIAALELWAGGERVGLTPSADPRRPAATARWEWTPDAAGDTVLVARAYDASGRSSQSAPLRVSVLETPPATVQLAEVRSLAGETLEDVARRAGGDPAVVGDYNAGLPPGALRTGTLVVVPVPDPTPPPPSAFREAPAGGFSFAMVTQAVNVAPLVPAGLATPGLDVAVQDCAITATATGATSATTGLAFSVLPPASDQFLALPPVAPAPTGGTPTTFAALPGTNYVSVAAYDEAASAPSAIVPVVVPEDCLGGTWQGTVRLVGTRLVAPTVPDRAYFYLKVGDAEWQRVPDAAGAFVEAKDGVLDFGGVLPDTHGADLGLEAWGWTGGALVALGNGTYDAPSTELYSGAWTPSGPVLPGYGTSLGVVVQAGGGESIETLATDSAVDLPGPTSQSAKRTFRWSTTLTGVTHLVWQVLPYPLSGSTALAPPFLIDTGTVYVAGLSTGTFKLDLKPYLTGGTGVTSATQWMGEQVVGGLVTGVPVQPGATPAPADVPLNPNGIWLPAATPAPTPGTAGGVPPQLGQAVLDDLAFLLPPPDALFVRVIPFSGTTPAGMPSNQVSFDVVEPGEPFYFDTSPPPSPPAYSDAHTMSAVFVPPTGSDIEYFGCVKVVKGGYWSAAYGDWTDGTSHCRPKHKDGWSLAAAFESFVSWVGTAWDYVSEGYDWIQDQVIEAVLAIVPCQKIADEVVDDGKGVCKAVAKTALHAVMIAYGIPPEVPSWEETIALAKGDLRTYILTNAKQFPGVTEACDGATAAHLADKDFPTCEELVDEAIDYAVDQIVDARSKAAADRAGVEVPQGITVEPHPKGMPQPPHFELKLTRTGTALPAGTVCKVTGRMESVVANWTWQEYAWTNGKETVVTKSGTVTGRPYLDATQAIAPLAPGQSISYKLWLSTRNVWFEPDGYADHYAQQYAEWNGQHNHAWVLAQPGATVTGKLSGNCSPAGESKQVLKGAAWD